jgi:ferrous iron transport protein A
MDTEDFGWETPNFFQQLLEKVLTNKRKTIIIVERLAEANRPGSREFLWQVRHMNLTAAVEGKEYIVQRIETDDEELDAFLFSLGCYAGEPITVVSRRRGGMTVSIKDGRYNIDNQLAEAILI